MWRNSLKGKIVEYIKYHKENVVKAVIIFSVIIFGLFISFGKDRPEEIVVEKNSASTSTEAIVLNTSGVEEVKYIFVDVSGAVNHPKVLKVEEDTRVYLAIEMAGGLQPNADISGINMAAKLKDENKIYIPKMGEKFISTAGNNLKQLSGVENNDKININTADSQQLQELSGVGPSTAEKIIQYREDHGSYLFIEDIKNVSGIGDKIFAKFRDKICI